MENLALMVFKKDRRIRKIASRLVNLSEKRNRKMDKIFMGIDPGKDGVLVVIFEDGLLGLEDRVDIIEGDVEALDVLEQIRHHGYNAKALIERQWSRPGFRPVDKLLIDYGQWIGRLEMADIPISFVTPKEWQQEMFKSAPKIYRTVKAKKVLATKTMSLETARLLFPLLRSQLAKKKDHNKSDALLIAELCRRRGEG